MAISGVFISDQDLAFMIKCMLDASVWPERVEASVNMTLESLQDLFSGKGDKPCLLELIKCGARIRDRRGSVAFRFE